MTMSSEELALKSRITALKMTNKARASHISSSLSLIDILSVVVSSVPLSDSRDLQDDLIVSKGHAAAGTYAVLAHAGYIDFQHIDEYAQNGSKLGGHVTSKNVPVLPLSTGSLGHGLSFAIGRAIAKRLKDKPNMTYVVLSDGECDEGSNWEGAMFAAHHNLSGLSVIIDRNRLQSLESTEETLRLEPLTDKWMSFGWDVVECDGHSHTALKSAIMRNSDKPKLTIANTIKGKGVSFMENSVLWHYRSPNEQELLEALEELESLIEK